MNHLRPLLWLGLLLLLWGCMPQRSLIDSSYSLRDAFATPFERDSNYTPTHDEVIQFYQRLARSYPQYFRLSANGLTDVGRPLHTGVLSFAGAFTPQAARDRQQCVVLINNAIHPGEPAGVDATMMLIRDALTNDSLRQQLSGITLVVIPMYNIGGALNRGSHSRANQVGPAAYGFRGNARNYDLNRDFIKTDTRNAQSFQEIFTDWRPHLFIDNHTSNGADYPYVMTLIPTHPDKLHAPQAQHLREVMLPYLYERMAATPYEMTPYVYAPSTPDKGILGFLDAPRYSTGYAALFNAIGFMPEAHMLKPYAQRVMGTYTLMRVMLDHVATHRSTIIAQKAAADAATARQQRWAVDWALDSTRVDSFDFKGYAPRYKPSAVTGQPRLYYDRTQPQTYRIPYYNAYRPTVTVDMPAFYIVPQSHTAVVERLRRNGVTLDALPQDRQLTVEVYYITDTRTPRQPYEGHFWHRDVQVRRDTQTLQYYQGDWLVRCNQPENQYIAHVLEPQSTDGFLTWNFFDAIFQQKEYFSAYVWEDVAADLLAQNPDLRRQLDAAKAQNPNMSAYEQLLWVYQHSPYYERTHRRYPIARWNGQ